MLFRFRNLGNPVFTVFDDVLFVRIRSGLYIIAESSLADADALMPSVEFTLCAWYPVCRGACCNMGH
jgi:hypothetical protein